jgi:hypothetical protein
MANNFLDALFIKVKTTAGLCTPNMEQLRNYIEKGREYTDLAKSTSSFVAMSPDLPAQLTKANEAMGKVLANFEKIDSHLGDIRAACEISEAVKVLNAWAKNPNADNAKAAVAFDKLFGGLSEYIYKFPTPIGQFSIIFKQIGIGKFFTGMQRIMDRSGQGQQYTPTGKALKYLNEQEQETFRPNNTAP